MIQRLYHDNTKSIPTRYHISHQVPAIVTICFICTIISLLQYISIHKTFMQIYGVIYLNNDIVDISLTVVPLVTDNKIMYPDPNTRKSNVMISNSSDPKELRNTTGTKEGFGACMMVRDDNDLLYEWIAYHYTVLSLRYLVIGCDIDSIQNVSIVLNRWKYANLTYPLQYWILQPNDFINRHATKTTNNNNTTYHNKQLSNDEWKVYHHHALIDRQKAFVTVCTELLKKNGIGWTLYIDSDEFVVWNPLPVSSLISVNEVIHDNSITTMKRDTTDKISDQSSRVRKQFSDLQVLGSNEKPNFYELILQLQQQGDMTAECYTMPRLLVGALENRTCPDRYEVDRVQQIAKLQLQDRFEHISTLRYFQHAKKGDFARSKYGKVMMDLSRIDDQTIQIRPPRNIHRPYTEYCNAAGGVYFPNAYFFLLHYIGSWERYTSRYNDQRRNRLEWERRAYVDDDMNMSACDSTVHDWYIQFQSLVGDDRIKYLLGVSDSSK